jgi:glycogen synthase
MPAAEPALAHPLRIALLSPDYPPDPRGTGIGTYSKLLAHYLTERGHTVHIVTRGVAQDSTEAITGQAAGQLSAKGQGRLILHRLGIARPAIPLELKPHKLVALIASSLHTELAYRRRIAAKLIESAEAFAESFFYQPKRHPRIPFIVKLHTPLAVGELFDKNLPEPLRRLVRHFERQLILKASHLSVPSAVSKELFCREMNLDRPIEVLANPPPLTLQQTTQPEKTPSACPEVLFVGRVTAFKGVFVLAKAIPLVLQAVPEARFVFVGADASNPSGGGSTIDALKASLSEGSLSRVDFTGHLRLEDVSAYYQRAAVCVFPSLFENFPYTCLEAMTYAKAIVGSANGGMTELLDGGRCGLLYHPPDEQELAKQIIRLLTDQPLRERLGTAARWRVATVFSAERVMDQTEAFYRRALQDCSPTAERAKGKRISEE